MRFPPKTLSLCMIVKDEEKKLAACLESVKDLPNEILIVDTGSTDGTIEIAKKFGARIYKIDWRNDFSYARNTSLDFAACAWILYLDADDLLDDQSIAGIKRLKNEVKNLNSAFGFKIKNDKGGGLGDEFLQIRMFPNDKRLRFEKKVHEQIGYSLKRCGYQIIHIPEITITHTGYNDDNTRMKKALRNRKIIESDIMNYPDDPNYLSAYGDTFAMVDEWDKAVLIYISVLDIPHCRQKQKDIYEYTFISIVYCYQQMEKYNMALQWVETGLNFCDKKIGLLFLGGEVCYAMGNYDKAFDYYINVYSAPNEYASTPIDNEGLKIKSAVQIGKIHQHNKNYKEAKKWFKIILDNYNNFHDMPGNMGELLLAEGDIDEAVKYFLESITMFPGMDKRAYMRIAEIYKQLGMKTYAVEYLEKAMRYFPNDLEIRNKLPNNIEIKCTLCNEIYNPTKGEHKCKAFDNLLQNRSKK